jgi:hypothetical protein
MKDKAQKQLLNVLGEICGCIQNLESKGHKLSRANHESLFKEIIKLQELINGDS